MTAHTQQLHHVLLLNLITRKKLGISLFKRPVYLCPTSTNIKLQKKKKWLWTCHLSIFLAIIHPMHISGKNTSATKRVICTTVCVKCLWGPCLAEGHMIAQKIPMIKIHVYYLIWLVMSWPTVQIRTKHSLTSWRTLSTVQWFWHRNQSTCWWWISETS